MKTIFRFTDHVRQRYAQRILNEKNHNQIKNLDSMIIHDIKDASEKREYLNLPRFVLYLWEKYGGTKHTRIFESEKAIYIATKEPDKGYMSVLTCWNKNDDYSFGAKGIFRTSVLSNTEIYNRIAVLKTKRR